MNKFSIKAKLLFILLSALTLFAYTACGSDSGSSGDDETQSYTVTFNTNGGSEIASQSVEEGKLATKPEKAPTKEGFTFTGWFTSTDEGKTLSDTEFDFATKITKNITLYAKWTEESDTPKEDPATVKISFDTNEGSEVTEIIAEIGKATKAPTAPTKGGFDFAGWFTDKELTKAFDFEKESAGLTEDIILYAKWTVKVFTVTFDTDGGTKIDAQLIEYNGTAKKPATNPTKANCTFSGWFADSEFKTEFDFAGKITKDTTVYAKWTPVIGTYEVKFDTNADSKVDTPVITEGQKANKPKAPTKEHYTFAGWFSDKDLKSEFSFDTAITEAITLYAKWTPVKYTVTFNSNGGSEIKAKEVEYNTTISAPETAPTKEHYTFAGWFSDSETTAEYDFADTPITGDLTLYAKWTPVKYTVTFETNGGNSIVAQPVEYNTTVTKPADPKKGEADAFEGWYTDSALTKAFNFETKITGNITLYAKWVDGVVVTFDPNYTGSTATKQTFIKGGKATKPADPTRANYVFKGWFKEASGTTAFDFAKTTLSDSITLYAKWAEAWTVTFDTKGGNSIAAKTVEKGSAIEKPANPTKTGYEFKGWFTSSDEGTTLSATAYNFATPVATSFTLYAKWEILTYKVDFVKDGATWQTKQANYGTPVTQPTTNPTKEGYTFKGWFTDTACTKAYNFTSNVTTNLTLYAKFVINTYTVTFNTNGGSEIGSQTVEHNKKATRPAKDPTREGYFFKDWYKSSSGNTKFDFSEPITKATTVYAQWSQAYTVKFVSNGGSEVATQTVAKNGTATEPTAPTQKGLEFDGWYTDEELTTAYVFTAQVTGNITLYAKWKFPGGGNAAKVTVTKGDIKVTQEQYDEFIRFSLPSGSGDWSVDGEHIQNSQSFDFYTSTRQSGIYILKVDVEINGHNYSYTAQIKVEDRRM